MEYKWIGETGQAGLRVSAVGLGCNAFGSRCDEATAAATVEGAIDAGINFFDTANTYGDGASEEWIGKTLAGRRQEVIIATKFGMRDGGSAKIIVASVVASLRRLGTDYIDLYQFHRPDPDTPISETLEALDRLVRDGKVRAIGCSNFSGAQLREAMAASGTSGGAAFVTAQNPYSILQRDIEAELVPECRAHGVGILPYYPLFRGMLTGKYRRGEPPPPGTRLAGGGRGAELLNDDAVFDRLEALEAFAADHGHTILDLAIAWLVAQPFVPSVIAGASKPDQVAANARAADWALTTADLAALDAIAPGPKTAD